MNSGCQKMASLTQVDGFDILLQQLQMDMAPSPTESNQSSSNAYAVSHHPPLPASIRRGYPPIDVSSTNFGGSSKPVAEFNNYSNKPAKRGTHRRAHSDTTFRLPDQPLLDHELGLENSSDSFTFSDENGEDLLPSYLKMDRFTQNGDAEETSGTNFGRHHVHSSSIDDVFMEFNNIDGSSDVKGRTHTSANGRAPPRHRHSMSMDGSISIMEDLFNGDTEILDSKKPMDIDQLAELALIDPRRAKRILANRQSAARSKERKMKYIAELEKKVQILQKEADSLSAQLSVLQTDTKGLTTENSELKLRLQSMEQQAQLRDALNDALKEEVKWLKSATVRVNSGNGHAFTMGVHQPTMEVGAFQMPLHSQMQLSTQMQQSETIPTNNGFSWQPAAAALDFSSFG